MVKKIFIVIGIVFGVVGAFTGVVLGVMAAQGKFKKQIVYPDAIILPDEIVVTIDNSAKNVKEGANGNEFVTDNQIHYFGITNSRKDNKKVTMTDCELEILGNGSQYIMLCDVNGNKLEPLETDSRKYAVSSSQYVYFKVKTINQSVKQNCRAILKVYSAYEDHPLTSNEMTINIDIPSKYPYIVGNGTIERSGDGKQSIIAPLGNEYSLYYKMEPFASGKPFDSRNQKVVEFYCHCNSDYILISQSNIENSSAIIVDDLTLKDLFRFDDDGSLVFIAPNIVTTIEVVMLMAPTYEAWEAYGVNHPNATDLEKVRSSEFVLTRLELSSEGYPVDNVNAVGYINLNLYQENYISIYGGISEYCRQDVINYNLQLMNDGNKVENYIPRISTAENNNAPGAWLSIVKQDPGTSSYTPIANTDFIFEYVKDENLKNIPNLFRIIPIDNALVGETDLYLQIQVRGSDFNKSFYTSLNLVVVGNDVSNEFNGQNIELKISYTGTGATVERKWVFSKDGKEGLFKTGFESSYNQFVMVSKEENVRGALW